VNIDVEDYYRRYAPMVLRRCRALLGEEARAVEAMQDTFVRVLDRQLHLKDEAPSSLLFRIATNICLNLIRKHRRGQPQTDPTVLESIASVDDVQGTSLAGNLLTAIFGGVSNTTRYLAVLVFVDGMTLEEVAQEVGMSVSGVRKRLAKLRLKAEPFRELIYV